MADEAQQLSGYRIMWVLVMFDLPVVEPEERKAATRFRNYLLDEGFEMAQFSVYMRFCKGKEQVQAIARRIEANLPSDGKVNILSFTDRQYENIISFYGRTREKQKQNPTQFSLF